MAAQSDADEVEALRARVDELERRCAEHESNDVVAPYLAAAVRMEAQCADLRDRCGALERENATLSLSLAYFHTQNADEVETIGSPDPTPDPTPHKNPGGRIKWGDTIEPDGLEAFISSLPRDDADDDDASTASGPNSPTRGADSP